MLFVADRIRSYSRGDVLLITTRTLEGLSRMVVRVYETNRKTGAVLCMENKRAAKKYGIPTVGGYWRFNCSVVGKTPFGVVDVEKGTWTKDKEPSCAV